MAAVGIFSSNVLFWHESGYFATEAELNPLLHTWSLAVEEQFYVLFPILLLIIGKAKQNTVVTVIAILTLLSLALAELLSRTLVSANFFLLPSRAWELGAGAIMALTVAGKTVGSYWLRQIISILGLAAIAASVLIFDGSVRFPSLYALLPVLGVMGLIACSGSDTWIGKILSCKPLVAVGLISYSAYLWHQPIIAFARIRSVSEPSDMNLLMLCLVSFVVAYLSWRFCEQPFRDRKRYGRSSIFKSGAAGTAALIFIGLMINFFDGYPGRFEKRSLEVLQYSGDDNRRKSECFSTPGKFVEPNDSCVYGDNNNVAVAIWGDSHAMTIADELGAALNGKGYGLREFSYSSCLPVLNYYNFEKLDRCVEYNNKVYQYLVKSNEIKVVVLHGRYILKTMGRTFDNHEGGKEPYREVYGLPVGKGRRFIENPERYGEMGALYAQTVEKLIAAGKQVVLVYPVPEAGWDVPIYMAKEIQFLGVDQKDLSTSHKVFIDRAKVTNSLLDQIPDSKKLKRVYPENIFCDSIVPDRCVVAENGMPLYSDNNHINGKGSAKVVGKIMEALDFKL